MAGIIAGNDPGAALGQESRQLAFAASHPPYQANHQFCGGTHNQYRDEKRSV
jgi:hypothetical protein